MERIFILTESQFIIDKLNHYSIIRSIDDILSTPEDAIIILVSFSKIIPVKIIQQRVFLNVHNSLLPKYRGRHAFTWAIINDEKEAGFSIHFVKDEIDSGALVAQLSVPLYEQDDINNLFERAWNFFFPWFDEQLDLINNSGLPIGIDQNHNEATYVGRRRKEDGCIDFNTSARYIYNFIRAQKPPYSYGAYFIYKNAEVIVLNSQVINCPDYIGIPGQVMNIKVGAGVLVKCADKIIQINEIIYNNKRLSSDKLITKIGIRL